MQLEKEFWNNALKSETLSEILSRSGELDLPDWHLGAGFVAQTIWNLKSGFFETQFIYDVDLVYFDSNDLSLESEIKAEELVRNHFKSIPLKFDVKNQARVHMWYEDKFGYAIPPYQSVYDAICTWPTSATAIGITRASDGPKVFAPFGLTDLMTMIVRPNKRQVNEPIYLSKVERWKHQWPLLKIIGWNEE